MYNRCWPTRVCRPCGGYGGRCVVFLETINNLSEQLPSKVVILYTCTTTRVQLYTALLLYISIPSYEDRYNYNVVEDMIRVRVASPTAHGCTCTIEYTTEVLRSRYPIRKYESTTLYCRPYVYGNRYEGTKVLSKVPSKVPSRTKVHTMIQYLRTEIRR